MALGGPPIHHPQPALRASKFAGPRLAHMCTGSQVHGSTARGCWGLLGTVDWPAWPRARLRRATVTPVAPQTRQQQNIKLPGAAPRTALGHQLDEATHRTQARSSQLHVTTTRPPSLNFCRSARPHPPQSSLKHPTILILPTRYLLAEPHSFRRRLQIHRPSVFFRRISATCLAARESLRGGRARGARPALRVIRSNRATPLVLAFR